MRLNLHTKTEPNYRPFVVHYVATFARRRSQFSRISQLKHFEILEFHYNQVLDLKKVFKSQERNENLKVLDLRLNPVTKTEPDYCLFVIHMLPNLRTFDIMDEDTWLNGIDLMN